MTYLERFQVQKTTISYLDSHAQIKDWTHFVEIFYQCNLVTFYNPFFPDTLKIRKLNLPSIAVIPFNTFGY